MGQQSTTQVIIHTTGLELKMDQFSGPMDLLLHMIRENQLNIYDIPICEITEAYLDVIRRAQTLQSAEIEYEWVGEFLVMASWLTYIKSAALLPLKDDGLQDDGVDPKELLVKQLLAYEEIKSAAAQLLSGELLGRDVFVRENAETGLKEIAKETHAADENSTGDIQAGNPLLLGLMYTRLLNLFEQKSVRMESEPIDYRAFFKFMIEQLRADTSHTFELSMDDGDRRWDLVQRVVLTLLVFLELSKRGLILISQPNAFAPLDLTVLDIAGLQKQKPDVMPETPEQSRLL